MWMAVSDCTCGAVVTSHKWKLGTALATLVAESDGSRSGHAALAVHTDRLFSLRPGQLVKRQLTTTNTT